MWQSERIKHWLGSTSQDVIVNRKSQLRGSISCGVSKMLCGPKQPWPSSKQESMVSLAEAWLGTHRHLGHLRASRQESQLPESPRVPRGQLWVQPLLLLQPELCSRDTRGAGWGWGSPRALAPPGQGGGRAMKCLSYPTRSVLIKQEMLPGCQSSSLAFQSVLEQLLVQVWALPVLGVIAAEKSLKCRREVAHGM